MPLLFPLEQAFYPRCTTEPLPQRLHWAPPLFTLEGKLVVTAGLKQRWLVSMGSE